MNKRTQVPVDFEKLLILLFCVFMTAALAIGGETAVAAAASVERHVNTISLKGGIEITLPSLPTDQTQLDAFRSLSPQERESFYYKRAWLIQRLVGGMTKPGIGRAIRWTKDKVTTTISAVRSRFSIAERATQEAELPNDDDVPSIDSGPTTDSSRKEYEAPVLEFNRVPDNFPEKTKALVESTVTSLVDNMWMNSVGIARSSGLGLSFAAGVIWNTTLGKYGLIRGRSLAVDIGMDFKNDRGYINFFIERQTKAQGGISFDVGTMFDVLLHITDPTLEVGTTRSSVHQKLPVIGCFRGGPTYRAWGSMFGIHVLEVASAVMTVLGYPKEGLATAATVRAIGLATVYRTNLEQRVVRQYQIPKDSWLLRKLNFGGMSSGFAGRTCRSLFAPTEGF